MQLAGQRIVITGGSQGFGRAIAEACLDAGASLLLCARSHDELMQTVEALSARIRTAGQRVLGQTADVSRPEDVTALVQRALSELGGIDGLVNNAGVYGPMGPSEEVDWSDWVRAIEINLYGTVLPCREVLPLFRKQGRGKIVNLSGGGATAPLPRISAYAASKAAVVRFAETLAMETLGTGIDVNSVAPGALNTRLLEQVLSAGPDKVGKAFFERAIAQQTDGGAPIAKGTALIVFLLSSQSDGITGRLISALWDPWSTLAARREELAKSDVYTLRRIVPNDRGLTWEEP
jgi:NAD(P)-dependent dehydrogenase (short-subunit alcohol dehydrogenase family)